VKSSALACQAPSQETFFDFYLLPPPGFKVFRFQEAFGKGYVAFDFF